MKKLFYLAIVLCAIACTNKKSSVNYAKFEPEDGKCLVFIGQDMEAIGGIEGKEGYVNFFGTPAGITTIPTSVREMYLTDILTRDLTGLHRMPIGGQAIALRTHNLHLPCLKAVT